MYHEIYGTFGLKWFMPCISFGGYINAVQRRSRHRKKRHRQYGKA